MNNTILAPEILAHLNVRGARGFGARPDQRSQPAARFLQRPRRTLVLGPAGLNRSDIGAHPVKHLSSAPVLPRLFLRTVLGFFIARFEV